MEKRNLFKMFFGGKKQTQSVTQTQLQMLYYTFVQFV